MPFDGANTNEITQYLINAKQYILDHGWCQHAVEDTKGRVCIEGAFIITIGIHKTYQVWEDLKKAFDVVSLAGYNDTHTYEEVLNAFDTAIKRTVLGTFEEDK